jgi:cytochrome c peroxidase
MGRFVVVVVLLLAIAFVAYKFLLKGGDPRPAEPAAPAAAADAKADAKDANDDANDGASDAEKAVAAVEATAAKADAKAEPAQGDMTEEEAVEISAEADVADAAAATTVETDVDPEAVVETEVAETAADVSGEELGDEMPTEEIDITDPSLTAGIPATGEGSTGGITLAELEQWLADPKNHVILKPILPLGLAAGQDAIKGLDKNPLTRAKIELGRQLYFDQRLSADISISCASCHDPDIGFAANTRFGIGVAKQEGGRNSPTAYNRILSEAQFWDGRAESLEEQAKGPIANPIEMSNTHEACVASLKKIPGYVLQFNQIFEDGLTIDNAARAIASFERVLVTGPAPWDLHKELADFEAAYSADIEDLDALKEEDPELYADYMKLKEAADKKPLSESAERGGELFFSDKSGCTACHVGANFTDELYHNLGVGMEADEPDLGRFVVTKVEKDKGAFKTPTVRNISLTGPFMHDGSQKTLEEVVEWYAKGGHPNQWLDEKVKKLELSDQDKKDLVAFMAEGLLGDLPKVERTRLPRDPEAAADNAAETAEAEAEEAAK